MKVTIEPSVFNKALKSVSPAIQSSPSIPILENIKCVVNGNEMEVSGTNTNLDIMVNVSCKSSDEGTFLLPFKTLSNLVALASYPIEINIDETIVVKIGRDKFKFGVPADIAHYPKNSEQEYQDTFPVNSDFISNLKSATKFTSVDKSGMNPLSYVCIGLRGDVVEIASCDRNSFYLFKENIGTKTKIEVMPDNSFIAALPLIEDGEISVSQNRIKFSNDTLSIIGTLTEHKFVDYSPFIKEKKVNCSLNRVELLDVLNKIMATKTIKTVTDLCFIKEGLKVHFVEDEFNTPECTSIIPCTHSVDFDEVTISAEVLRSIIQEMPVQEKLSMYFTDKKVPVYLYSDEGKNIGFVATINKQ